MALDCYWRIKNQRKHAAPCTIPMSGPSGLLRMMLDLRTSVQALRNIIQSKAPILKTLVPSTGVASVRPRKLRTLLWAARYAELKDSLCHLVEQQRCDLQAMPGPTRNYARFEASQTRSVGVPQDLYFLPVRASSFEASGHLLKDFVGSCWVRGVIRPGTRRSCTWCIHTDC